MKQFILTGAAGSGKTSIIRQLEAEGFSIVEEAATDVIARQQAQGIGEPWTKPSFIDAVAALQRDRQLRAAALIDKIQFHDRSIVCTLALATYLRHPISEILKRELERIEREAIFEKRVFFINNLGFITPTEARRISFEENLIFEKINEETYRNLGYEIVFVTAGSLAERVTGIKKALGLN
jgi:predicted ATPase